MIRMEDVSFSYGDAKESGGIRDINLHIKEGEFIVIAGASGCGKTTLTRLVNGLIPHYYEGNLQGKIYVSKEDIQTHSISQMSCKVASVFQNPRSQFFSVDSTGELAFQLENRGVEPKAILEKMSAVIEQFQIEKLMGRSLFQLSGGEKQKLACAGAALSEADIIVLDEPSSNLDLDAIEDLKTILKGWKKSGKTILISEHRLYYLRELVDRMLFMKKGAIVKDIKKDSLLDFSQKDMNQYGLRTLSLDDLSIQKEKENSFKEKLQIKSFQFRYRNQEHGIDIDELSIQKGSVVAIIGRNGAGKSTFAKCMCGLEKQSKAQLCFGEKTYHGKQLINQCFLVMQDVNYQLFTESVRNEVEISLRDYGSLKEQERQDQAESILKQMKMKDYGEYHPMALSGGQKQRVALACAMASKRPVLFFDEPTSGLDYRSMERVAEQVRERAKDGTTIFVITHDLELILNCCTHVLHLSEGKIKDFFEMKGENIQRIRTIFLR